MKKMTMYVANDGMMFQKREHCIAHDKETAKREKPPSRFGVEVMLQVRDKNLATLTNMKRYGVPNSLPTIHKRYIDAKEKFRLLMKKRVRNMESWYKIAEAANAVSSLVSKYKEAMENYGNLKAMVRDTENDIYEFVKANPKCECKIDGVPLRKSPRIKRIIRKCESRNEEMKRKSILTIGKVKGMMGYWVNGTYYTDTPAMRKFLAENCPKTTKPKTAKKSVKGVKKSKPVENKTADGRKREWKAVGKDAVLFVDGVPSGYSEPFGSHKAAVDGAERLNEEDVDGMEEA